jgi:hypothetical protein
LVYVSYAWRSRIQAGEAGDLQAGDDREQIVDELCAILEAEDQIVVGRDKKIVKTGDSIEDFASQIASGGLILAVISYRSLRSDWCMLHELLQAFRRRNFKPEEFGSDVLALVLEDALADLADQRALVEHWAARLEQKRAPLQLADPDRKFSTDSWRDVDELSELRGRLPDLLRALRIRAMPRGAEAIRQENFRAIRELVRERLDEKTRLAEAISPSRVMATPGAEGATAEHLERTTHFLAVMLQRQHEASGDSGDLLYSWQAYLKKPSERHYAPLEISTELGSLVRPSPQPVEPSAAGVGKAHASLADLVQAAVDWLRKQSFGARCVLELFVPIELLDFGWSTLPVVDRRRRNSPPADLRASVAYVLRSWERLEDPDYESGRETLKLKYACLERGQGVWLAGPEANSPQHLSAVETDSTLVGIKRLSPLEDQPELRLEWLESMLITMAPVVLWRPHGRPSITKAQLHAHLKRYDPDLAGHKTGDKVSSTCACLESLPLRRKTIAHDPLVHDLVFLLDHPHRAPAPISAQPDIISF